ncbi:MAG: MotA/TolQ/ExbB proton channel family protein [Pirellulales bacterium]
MNALLPHAANLLLLFGQFEDLDTKPDIDSGLPDAPAAAAPADPVGAAPATPADGASSPAAPGEAAAAPAADGEAKPDGAEAAEKDQQPSTPTPTWYSEMFNSGAMYYMRRGGLFMWPILLVGIFAVGAIIERYRSLKMLRTDTEKLRSQVTELLNADKVEDALSLCEDQQGPVPAVLASGLRKFLLCRRLGYDAGKIEEQVVKAMDDYSVHIVAALEKHLPILATAASVAPMLGFLGTVQGMVTSFETIVTNFGKENIVLSAAGGIMTSLLTTVFGLVVGIPAYTAYNYFASVINGFVLQVEETSTELIEAVTLQMALGQRKAQSNAAARPPQPAAAPTAAARPQPAPAPHPPAEPVAKQS